MRLAALSRFAAVRGADPWYDGVVHRHPSNPILTRLSIPDVPPHVVDATSVFNPGAIRIGGEVVLLLRVQTRGRRTFFMRAESRDGVSFRVRPEIVRVEGLEASGLDVYHVYDPRLTRLGGDVYATFAADTEDGCRVGVAKLVGVDRLEVVSFSRDVDSRNAVLFPEKIGGRWLRLERPNRVRLASGPMTGDAIWLAESDDLVEWRLVQPVLSGRLHFWDELVGSGPPPLKTERGWLHVYHGVATHFASSNIYQAGVCLLDRDDPGRLLARGRDNVLEPRETWEMVGQVPNVVFPSGMIADDVDQAGFARPESRVLVYYGAADTVVGLAETTVAALLEACDAS
ncbi:MAG: glycoside hydrolase family 130 protein [bacterium]